MTVNDGDLAFSVPTPLITPPLLRRSWRRSTNGINAARLNMRFVAMLFAVLDSTARQVIIANAGNRYPLLMRKGKIEEIPLSEFRLA